MAKKKIEIRKEYLNQILNDRIKIEYTKRDVERNLEEDVDDKVKNALKVVYKDKVIAKKTGVPEIDDKIPPYHGEEGTGHPDVMIFNYFGDNKIDLIIEDKNFTSKENSILQ